MKTCPKCSQNKQRSEFYKNSKTPDGLKSWCKECHKADSRKREPKYNETRRKYREENKEGYQANKREYYKNNKVQVLEGNRAWRQTRNGRLMSYKRSAEQREIPFELTDKQFFSFWNKDCSYCGDKIKTIGIDRADSTQPYKIDNCVPCCKVCNTMKMSLTREEFVCKLRSILNHIGDTTCQLQVESKET